MEPNALPEMTVYIHGVWVSESGAIEQADRTRLSLFQDHYKIPVIGYAWDSNTARFFCPVCATNIKDYPV